MIDRSCICKTLPADTSVTEPLNSVKNATDSGPVLNYGIEKCRGHWHVTSCGETLIGSYNTPEEAQRIADQNNAGDHSEPRGITNEDALNLARRMIGPTPPISGDALGEALDELQKAARETGQPKVFASTRAIERLAHARSRIESLVAALEKQITALTGLTEWYDAECERLRAENERLEQWKVLANNDLRGLRASSLSKEEAQHALDQIPDNQCGWPPEDCATCDSIREKLARGSERTLTRGNDLK